MINETYLICGFESNWNSTRIEVMVLTSMAFQLPPEIRDNQAQCEAIMHGKGPVMIIAGPGSGKTKVLVWRAAKLLIQDGVEPERIWLTTFTVKAARQLRAEIATIIKEFNAPVQVPKMLIGTIHSTCFKLIREYSDYFPEIPNPPRVLNEDRQLILLLSNYKRLKLDRTCDTPGRRPDIGRIYEVIDHLNWLTDFEVDSKNYEDYVLAAFNKGDKSIRERDIWMTKTYREYLALLKELGYLDFGHILRNVLNAIETKSFDREIARKINYILVDEYQDVNLLQQRILMKVAKANSEENITVVGDDDQAIYQFRGAGVGTLRDFENIFHPRKIELSTNYRSSKYVVAASSSLIATNASQERFAKKLHANENRQKEHLKVLKISDEFLTETAEKTVELLKCMKESGKIRRYGDIAILLRSIKPNHLGPYISALKKLDVPFTVLGRTGLFSTPIGMGVLLYFDFLSHPKPIFLEEFLNSQPLDFEVDTIEKIASLDGYISPKRMEQLNINKRDKEIILEMLDIHEASAKLKIRPLEAIYSFLNTSNFLSKKMKQKDDEALEVISKITKIAREFEEMYSPSVSAFTDYIKGLWEAGRAEMPEVSLTAPDYLKIMTVHQAKGLEFPVVVVGEAIKGRFPSPDLGHFFCRSKQVVKRPTKEEIHEYEEKRLFYVAMTRARDLLIINTAEKISPLSKRKAGETPWLKTIPSKNLCSPVEVISHIKKRLGWDFEYKKERRVFSFSTLNYYRFCPLRYRFVRELGLAFPIKIYFVAGSNVHRALECIHTQTQNGFLPKEDEVESIVEKCWEDVPTSEQKNIKIKNAAVKYLKNYIKNFPIDPKSIHAIEKEFWVFFDEGILTGKIDLIRKDEDGDYEIIDFKIGMVPGFDYEEQLKTYVLGVRLGLNIETRKATIHLLKPTKQGRYVSPQKFVFPEEDIEQAQKSVVRTMTNIENGYFAPDPSVDKCKKCELEGYGLCPYAPKR